MLVSQLVFHQLDVSQLDLGGSGINVRCHLIIYNSSIRDLDVVNALGGLRTLCLDARRAATAHDVADVNVLEVGHVLQVGRLGKVSVLMCRDTTIGQLRDMIHIHPTLGELLLAAASI